MFMDICIMLHFCTTNIFLKKLIFICKNHKNWITYEFIVGNRKISFLWITNYIYPNCVLTWNLMHSKCKMRKWNNRLKLSIWITKILSIFIEPLLGIFETHFEFHTESYIIYKLQFFLTKPVLFGTDPFGNETFKFYKTFCLRLNY